MNFEKVVYLYNHNYNQNIHYFDVTKSSLMFPSPNKPSQLLAPGKHLSASCDYSNIVSICSSPALLWWARVAVFSYV